jgi:uncharacterized coiled-coil protein SlyX
MLHLLLRAERPFQIGCALGLAALIGWGGFIYTAFSSRHELSAVRAELNEALANHERLQQTAGDLSHVQAKLSATRLEYGRTVQAWAETRARTEAAQQELATLTKRLDQARDRVSQTGSIRSEPPKAPARKP